MLGQDSLDLLTEAQAVLILGVAYKNVLHEFAQCEASVLRLLPISGGIFAGSFQPIEKIAPLTAKAIQAGIKALSAEDTAKLSTRDIQLCIFEEVQYQAFLRAMKVCTRATV